MPSYRQILYHLVFRTKYGNKVLVPEYSRELYAYIMGYIRNKRGFLYRINGMEDHLHILCDLHPSIALADFMKDLKASSSLWLKRSGKFPGFQGWAEGYGAFTCYWRDREVIIKYIKGQQEHHGRKPFETELRELIKEHGVEFREEFFP